MGMPLISKVLKLVASFCICTIVLYIIKSKVISGSDINNPFVGFVVYAGKNTIVIYLTHFFFVEMLKVPSVELNNLTPIWVLMISLCASIAIAAVCLLIGKVVEHFEWVNKLVYGRW